MSSRSDSDCSGFWVGDRSRAGSGSSPSSNYVACSGFSAAWSESCCGSSFAVDGSSWSSLDSPVVPGLILSVVRLLSVGLVCFSSGLVFIFVYSRSFP